MGDPRGLAAGAWVNAKEIYLDHSELVLPAKPGTSTGQRLEDMSRRSPRSARSARPQGSRRRSAPADRRGGPLNYGYMWDRPLGWRAKMPASDESQCRFVCIGLSLIATGGGESGGSANEQANRGIHRNVRFLRLGPSSPETLLTLVEGALCGCLLGSKMT